MKAKLMGLLKDEEGQGMTEYGIIIALIAIVVIAVIGTMDTSIRSLFTRAAGDLDAVAP